ncbi:hypothetical protein [Candidatus Acidianus copahuensis]|nr:hypothetical protein [Candidatus Acidianus copahuensis]
MKKTLPLLLLAILVLIPALSHSSNVTVANSNFGTIFISPTSSVYSSTYDNVNGFLYAVNGYQVQVINGTNIIGNITLNCGSIFAKADDVNGLVYVVVTTGIDNYGIIVIQGEKVISMFNTLGTIEKYNWILAVNQENGFAYFYTSNTTGKFLFIFNGDFPIYSIKFNVSGTPLGILPYNSSKIPFVLFSNYSQGEYTYFLFNPSSNLTEVVTTSNETGTADTFQIPYSTVQPIKVNGSWYLLSVENDGNFSLFNTGISSAQYLTGAYDPFGNFTLLGSSYGEITILKNNSIIDTLLLPQNRGNPIYSMSINLNDNLIYFPEGECIYYSHVPVLVKVTSSYPVVFSNSSLLISEGYYGNSTLVVFPGYYYISPIIEYQPTEKISLLAWDINGIENITSNYIQIEGNTTIVGLFQKLYKIMIYDNLSFSESFVERGLINLYAQSNITIGNVSYIFENWSASGNASILDASSSSTKAFIYGPSSIIANYVPYDKVLVYDNLTYETLFVPNNSVIDVISKSEVNASQVINYFHNWTVTGGIDVVKVNSTEISVKVLGPSSIIANYVPYDKVLVYDNLTYETLFVPNNSVIDIAEVNSTSINALYVFKDWSIIGNIRLLNTTNSYSYFLIQGPGYIDSTYVTYYKVIINVQGNNTVKFLKSGEYVISAPSLGFKEWNFSGDVRVENPSVYLTVLQVKGAGRVMAEYLNISTQTTRLPNIPSSSYEPYIFVIIALIILILGILFYIIRRKSN